MLRRLAALTAVLLIFGQIIHWPISALHAQQTIVVNPQFQFIRQGAVGVITVSGPGIIGATANVLDRTYTFFPSSNGYASLIAVPLDQKIQDYPLKVSLQRTDGAALDWEGKLKVTSGQFFSEAPYVLPSEKVFLLNDQIQRSEDDKLLQTFSMVTPTRLWEGNFSLPINGSFTAPFGNWRTFNGGVRRRHYGIDIRAASNTPVLAAATGRVVLSRPLDIHGESIVIDHGWGVYTGYAHFTSRFVVPGQFVLQGDIIGLSGNTGRSLGPHLHWEVAVNGIWVDPAGFLSVKLPN